MMQKNGKTRTRAKKTHPKYLTADQAKRLIDTPYKNRPHHRLAIWTGLHGLRASEIINLEARDLDLTRGFIFVREGKGGKDRLVPMTAGYEKEIKEYLELRELQPQDRLFPMTRQGLYQMIKRYGGLSGIEKERGEPVTVHSLRHTYGVQSVLAGVDLRSLQRAMGHSSLEITAIYLEMTAEDLKKAYEKNPLPY